MASHTTDGNTTPAAPLEPPTGSAHDGAIVLSLVGGQQVGGGSELIGDDVSGNARGAVAGICGASCFDDRSLGWKTRPRRVHRPRTHEVDDIFRYGSA